MFDHSRMNLLWKCNWSEGLRLQLEFEISLRFVPAANANPPSLFRLNKPLFCFGLSRFRLFHFRYWSTMRKIIFNACHMSENIIVHLIQNTNLVQRAYTPKDSKERKTLKINGKKSPEKILKVAMGQVEGALSKKSIQRAETLKFLQVSFIFISS